MFDYIGRKIKVLAKVLFWGGLIFWILCGAIGIIGSIADGKSAEAISYFIGVVVLVLCTVISSWLLYGLGQLIDNTDKLVAQKNNTYIPEKEKISPKDTIINLSDTDVREEQPKEYGSYNVAAKDLRVKSDPDVRVCVSPLDETPKKCGSYYTPFSDLRFEKPTDNQG